MCGFVGFFTNGYGGDRNAVIKAMADRIIHRGPDQDDYYVDDDMALGFRRLSIIDLEGGSQPDFERGRDEGSWCSTARSTIPGIAQRLAGQGACV